VLRLIGILALLYFAYWAGMNGVSMADIVAHIQNLLAGIDTAAD